MMSDWWNEVDEELTRRSEGAPDPWADLDAESFGDSGALSPDQQAFLRQVGELPPIGRFDD